MARRGRPPHPDVLTPRQREVLTLVRDGLSNREIADRLDISLDGAKFHVQEIIGRLGVTSRREAAEWLERRTTDAPAASMALGWRGYAGAMHGGRPRSVGVELRLRRWGSGVAQAQAGAPAVHELRRNGRRARDCARRSRFIAFTRRAA
jgi:DNA-binding CsgD family transcriptional regulator